MAEVPWWMLSPSPMSLIQYAILTFYGGCHLLKIGTYQRLNHPKVFSFLDGFFVAAFFVVLGDAFWSGFCALKWVPMFPQDLSQILFSFLRDLIGLCLFFLLIPIRVMNFSLKVKAGILVMLISQGVWFLLAPSPAFTDYTFAWRHGFPLEVVGFSFFLSHFVMRLPLWFIVYEVMRIEFNSTGFKRAKEHNRQPLEN